MYPFGYTHTKNSVAGNISQIPRPPRFSPLAFELSVKALPAADATANSRQKAALGKCLSLLRLIVPLCLCTRQRAATSPRNNSADRQDNQRYQEITSPPTVPWPCQPSSVKPPDQPPTSPSHLSSLCANRQPVHRTVHGAMPSPARRDGQRTITKLFASPLLCTQCIPKNQVNPALHPRRHLCHAKTSIGAQRILSPASLDAGLPILLLPLETIW